MCWVRSQRACWAPRTVHLGDQVCQVHGPDQGEVARLGGEEVLLLVICCGRGARMSALCFCFVCGGGERDAGDRNVHDTCPAFWAPPLVAADEVLFDMAAAVVVGDAVGVGGGRECSCGVEGRFLPCGFDSVV